MAKILLLEDDPVLAKSLCFNIQSAGYDVQWVSTVALARKEIAAQQFDLLLLDIELPDGSGLKLCEELRSFKEPTPIVLITAQNSEENVVQGLMAGANDYIRKPFGMREMLARLHVQLKTVDRKAPSKSLVEFGGLKVDSEHRTAFYKDRELKLNHTKLDILHFLITNQKKVISRETILQFLQKEDEVFDRTIDAHISQIRRLLKEEKIDHIRITSIYGTGYKLEATPEQSASL